MFFYFLLIYSIFYFFVFIFSLTYFSLIPPPFPSGLFFHPSPQHKMGKPPAKNSVSVIKFSTKSNKVSAASAPAPEVPFFDPRTAEEIEADVDPEEEPDEADGLGSDSQEDDEDYTDDEEDPKERFDPADYQADVDGLVVGDDEGEEDESSESSSSGSNSDDSDDEEEEESEEEEERSKKKSKKSKKSSNEVEELKKQLALIAAQLEGKGKKGKKEFSSSSSKKNKKEKKKTLDEELLDLQFGIPMPEKKRPVVALEGPPEWAPPKLLKNQAIVTAPAATAPTNAPKKRRIVQDDDDDEEEQISVKTPVVAATPVAHPPSKKIKSEAIEEHDPLAEVNARLAPLPPRNAKVEGRKLVQIAVEADNEAAAKQRAAAAAALALVPKFETVTITDRVPELLDPGFTSTQNFSKALSKGSGKVKMTSDDAILEAMGFGTTFSLLPHNPVYPKGTARSVTGWNGKLTSTLYTDLTTADILLLIKTFGPDLSSLSIKDACFALGISQKTVREMTDTLVMDGYFACN